MGLQEVMILCNYDETGSNLRMHSFCVNFCHVVFSNVMVNVIDALRLSGSGVSDTLMLSSSGIN